MFHVFECLKYSEGKQRNYLLLRKRILNFPQLWIKTFQQIIKNIIHISYVYLYITLYYYPLKDVRGPGRMNFDFSPIPRAHGLFRDKKLNVSEIGSVVVARRINKHTFAFIILLWSYNSWIFHWMDHKANLKIVTAHYGPLCKCRQSTYACKIW